MVATHGYFMNIDSGTKFVQTVSILKQYNESLDQGFSKKQIFEKYNSSNVDNPRVTVITEHNSKSYQVDGMTDDFSPNTYTFKNKNNEEVSMTKYFFETYKIKLTEK